MRRCSNPSIATAAKGQQKVTVERVPGFMLGAGGGRHLPKVGASTPSETG
jgi:hypothetical protein